MKRKKYLGLFTSATRGGLVCWGMIQGFAQTEPQSKQDKKAVQPSAAAQTTPPPEHGIRAWIDKSMDKRSEQSHADAENGQRRTPPSRHSQCRSLRRPLHVNGTVRRIRGAARKTRILLVLMLLLSTLAFGQTSIPTGRGRTSSARPAGRKNRLCRRLVCQERSPR